MPDLGNTGYYDSTIRFFNLPFSVHNLWRDMDLRSLHAYDHISYNYVHLYIHRYMYIPLYQRSAPTVLVMARPTKANKH